jgi:hypothetical protein
VPNEKIVSHFARILGSVLTDLHEYEQSGNSDFYSMMSLCSSMEFRGSPLCCRSFILHKRTVKHSFFPRIGQALQLIPSYSVGLSLCTPCRHKVQWRYRSSHPYPCRWMVLNGQLPPRPPYHMQMASDTRRNGLDVLWNVKISYSYWESF